MGKLTSSKNSPAIEAFALKEVSLQSVASLQPDKSGKFVSIFFMV